VGTMIKVWVVNAGAKVSSRVPLYTCVDALGCASKQACDAQVFDQRL